MNDTVTSFTRSLFLNAETQRVADIAYGALLNGNSDALRLLSSYLVGKGMVVIIKGHEVRARSAGGRATHPPQLIFDLHGGQSAFGDVACAYQSSAHCKSYHLDTVASKSLHEMEHRYVDEGGTVTPYRSVEEGDMLRN